MQDTSFCLDLAFWFSFFIKYTSTKFYISTADLLTKLLALNGYSLHHCRQFHYLGEERKLQTVHHVGHMGG
jgi:hypothetical protein